MDAPLPGKHHGETGMVVVLSLMTPATPSLQSSHTGIPCLMVLVTAVFVLSCRVGAVMFLLSDRAVFGKHGRSTEEYGPMG